MEDEIHIPQTLHVLSLEDSDIDYELVTEQLDLTGFRIDISRAETELEFTSLIRNNNFDIILADYMLPQFDAFGALELCQEFCPDVPFICVSGSIGEMKAIELLKNGAVDYVIKDRMERLPFAIKRALDEARIKLENKNAQEALRKSEERLRDILFSTADWVWEVDENGKYTYSSQRDIDLFNVSPNEIIGKTPFDFMPAEEANRVSILFSEIVANKLPIKDLENWNIGKNGEPVCLLTNGLPIIDQDGQLKGYRGIDKNITERKRAEQELIKAKERAEASDRLKTAFMNNISHEIRTPLNGILGFSQIITDPTFSEFEKEGHYGMLNESCDRLINTVTNIMDVSLLASGNQKAAKTEVVLFELISHIHKKFKTSCQQKRITFSMPEDTKLRILTDEELLTKIFYQLIDNAVKFTSNGTIAIGCEKHNQEYHFFVKDSGIGISEEYKNRIFGNFEQEDFASTRKYEGTGIGLSIAKGFVELLGGKIWVDSQKGKGSTFYFSIPFE
ncbi:MAG: ATP-binding protein [Prolixibacteraceae bacterium]|nr:ATP-binding protein [Prolixibacteraceae bacterium]